MTFMTQPYLPSSHAPCPHAWPSTVTMTPVLDAPTPHAPPLADSPTRFQHLVSASPLSPGSACFPWHLEYLIAPLPLSCIIRLWALRVGTVYFSCISSSAPWICWHKCWMNTLWWWWWFMGGNASSKGPEMSIVCLEIIKANIPGGGGSLFGE